MRHVLVAVSGLSPQIVTETLYGLMVQNPKEPIHIDEVYVLTTKKGKDIGVETLLGNDGSDGWFHSLRRDFGLGEICFPPDHFIVFGGNDNTLGDIRSAADNARIGDEIVGFIRRMTAEPDVAIHASIAGGRKTMGAYLSLAMQLYGRPQDTLSHVLVSEEFESSRDFFYPPPKNRRIVVAGRDGSTRTLQTKDARIELADIPFVRIRPYINANADFVYKDLVRMAQDEIDACPRFTVSVDAPGKSLVVGDRRIPLRPIELAFYDMFLTFKRACRRKRGCTGCEECYQKIDKNYSASTSVQQVFATSYERIVGKGSGRVENRQGKGLDSAFFSERISRVNKVLKKSLSPAQYGLLEIRKAGKRGEASFGILQEREMIG